jgi:hypothetical protein
MVLRTHNLPSGRLKHAFCEEHEVMFQCVDWPCELIFCILGIDKSDLDDVD